MKNIKNGMIVIDKRSKEEWEIGEKRGSKYWLYKISGPGTDVVTIDQLKKEYELKESIMKELHNELDEIISMFEEIDFDITGESKGRKSKIKGDMLLSVLKTNLKISNTADAFVNHVTMHVTDETSELSKKDVINLVKWYNANKENLDESASSELDLAFNDIRDAFRKLENKTMSDMDFKKLMAEISKSYGEKIASFATKSLADKKQKGGAYLQKKGNNWIWL